VIFIDREKDKKEIRVDQMRAVSSDMAILPNDGDKKIYIIKHADTMNVPAQNAMLKALEDPPNHVIFILSLENPALLLPTVRSRCIEVTVPPKETEPEYGEDAEKLFKLILDGDSLALSEYLFSIERIGKSEFADLIDGVLRLSVRAAREGQISSGEAARIAGILKKPADI
jgi:DNA polymerase III delta prime subunit